MDLGFIFLAIALIGLVVFAVAQPFLERRSQRPRAVAGDESLAAERDRILASVRDLDFDHATGKITDEDYQPQRAALMARGAEVLKQLDTAGVVDETDAIEQAIAARRKVGAVAPAQPVVAAASHACPGCGAAVQANDRFCPGCGAALTRVCAHCAAPLTDTDRFCGRCGTPVAVEAQS